MNRVSAVGSRQIAIFDEILKKSANARSLDAEVFYKDPESTLQNVFGFIEQAVDGSDISDIVGSDLYHSLLKKPESELR